MTRSNWTYSSGYGNADCWIFSSKG